MSFNFIIYYYLIICAKRYILLLRNIPHVLLFKMFSEIVVLHNFNFKILRKY